jgi:hypothetical protein
MPEPDRDRTKPNYGLLGFLILCLLIVSGTGLVSGCLAVGERDFTGAGVCLIAATLPLGLLVNSLLKK